MKAPNAVTGIARLGLDSAPILYFVEGNAEFHARCKPLFEAVDAGTVEAFTSTLTLPEVLMYPLRNNNTVLATSFRQLLLNTQRVTTAPPVTAVAEEAARLRAVYNLRTADAIQIATSIHFGCDAFLTNDVKLKRVTELRIIVVSELDI